MINFRELSLHNVSKMLSVLYHDNENLAYIADKEHLFKYIGTSKNRARYIMGCHDKENNMYYASVIYVYISHDTLVADYGSMPIFETTSENELEKFIKEK